MSDFAEQIRQRVAAARDAADERQHAAAGQAQLQVDDRLARRKSRASELCAEIARRCQEAADGSSGAMRYDQRTDHYGRVTATLSWRDPGPPRELKIYINPLEGVMDWSWVVNRVVKKAPRTDPLAFDRSRLDGLIYLLSDQEAWSKGQSPI